MNLVSWNHRGLGSKGKKEAMKKIISSEKPKVLLIQETKLGESETFNEMQNIWKKSRVVLSSREASGGIGTF